jgi:cytochrome c biogenesis protein CcdA
MSYSFLIALIGAAFWDSINPTAISMTFLILGSKKQKSLKTWLYTLGIFVTNFIFGFALLYILSNFSQDLKPIFEFRNNINSETYIKEVIINAPQKYLLIYFISQLIIGPAILYFAIKNRKVDLKRKVSNFTDSGLWGAFKLGIILTFWELTSSAPYLAVLTGLSLNKVNWPISILTLMVYNFIFVLPIIILNGISIFFSSHFESVAPFVNKLIEVYLKIIRFILFTLVVLIGSLMTFAGITGVYKITENAFGL